MPIDYSSESPRSRLARHRISTAAVSASGKLARTLRLFGAPLLLLGLFCLSGCGSSAAGNAAEPDPGDLAAARRDGEVSDRPPLALSAPLAPTPVPATFDVADLAEKVRPTVVNILTVQRVAGSMVEHPFDFFFGPDGGGRGPGGERERQGAGTGFIIDASGYVVTNEHVVRDADSVTVRLADERELAADVVGRDPKLDLALLKVKNGSDLPAAQLGTSESLRIGEHVLAVGNPFGLGHTVTLGIVSAKARSIGAGPYDEFIQTDAAINPGNSGGPLFNWRGEVVGINTAIRPGANSIGFAIPIDALRNVLDQLRTNGHVTRGKLGLAFQPVTADLAQALGLPGPKGAVVAALEPGGPAARAGLQPGDVILSVGTTSIAHAEELPRAVARNAPGTKLPVKYVRGGQTKDTVATLSALDDEPDRAASKPGPEEARPRDTRLGLRISPARGGGVRIEEIAAGSPANKELRPGDIVVEVGGKPIAGPAELEQAVERAKPGEVLLVKVRRGGATRFAALRLR
jgi:serine protease Do